MPRRADDRPEPSLALVGMVFPGPARPVAARAIAAEWIFIRVPSLTQRKCASLTHRIQRCDQPAEASDHRQETRDGRYGLQIAVAMRAAKYNAEWTDVRGSQIARAKRTARSSHPTNTRPALMERLAPSRDCPGRRPPASVRAVTYYFNWSGMIARWIGSIAAQSDARSTRDTRLAVRAALGMPRPLAGLAIAGQRARQSRSIQAAAVRRICRESGASTVWLPETGQHSACTLVWPLLRNKVESSQDSAVLARRPHAREAIPDGYALRGGYRPRDRIRDLHSGFGRLLRVCHERRVSDGRLARAAVVLGRGRRYPTRVRAGGNRWRHHRPCDQDHGVADAGVIRHSRSAGSLKGPRKCKGVPMGSHRILMLPLVALSFAGCAHLQPTQAWPELVRRLETGNPVAVTDAEGREVRGRVAAASSASLTLDVNGTARQFDSTDVRQVRRDGDRLWNGLAIGAGIGVLGSALMDNRCSGQPVRCDDKQVPERIAFLAMTTAAGIGIDALHRDRRTVYESPGRVTLKVLPILTMRTRGLLLVIRAAP